MKTSEKPETTADLQRQIEQESLVRRRFFKAFVTLFIISLILTYFTRISWIILGFVMVFYIREFRVGNRRINELYKRKQKMFQVEKEQADEREKKRRLREGLSLKPSFDNCDNFASKDTVVESSRWSVKWNGSASEWLEGEVQYLIPTDIVLKYGWQLGGTCGSYGVAIKRNGKIVATHTEMVS